jgi:uncharacterized protein (DUF1800 family)
MSPKQQALRAFTATVLVAQLVLPASLLGEDKPVESQRTTLEVPGVRPLSPTETRLHGSSAALSQDDKDLLALDRFTYGPRPGDLAHVKQIGLSEWFHQQLNPATISDAALNERLAQFPAMNLPLDQLFRDFPDISVVKATAKKGKDKADPTMDPTAQAVFAARVDAYRDKIKLIQSDGGKKGAKNTDDSSMAAKDVSGVMAPMDAAKAEPKDKVTRKSVMAEDAVLSEPRSEIDAMAPQARFQYLMALPPAQLLEAVREKKVGGEELTAGFTPAQRETIAAVRSPESLIESEITVTKLLRDVYSERQLQEVMVDFWANHFNVYIKKGKEAPYYITQFERDAIRPYALGHFSDLLLATAQSPEMLYYLDGFQSVGAHSEYAEQTQAKQPAALVEGAPKGKIKKLKDTGLNENYAREVMELHSVGVDAGYSQKDVTELAKVFTGWTIHNNVAEFDPSRHEPGDKTVMGHVFHDTGMSEGTDALKMLASTPQCAHFISRELAVRFMGDEPQADVVDRMAASYLATKGDIREVLMAMVNSPQFFTAATYRSKVKTPQDFVVSAVRATDADVETPLALAAAMKDLGMPLYGMLTPNGYSMKSADWNSTSALIDRMNFSMALADNRVAGVHIDVAALLGPEGANMTARQKQDAIEARLLHAPVSAKTEQLVYAQTSLQPEAQQAELKQVSEVKASAIRYGKPKKSDVKGNGDGDSTDASLPVDMQSAMAVGLILGSPEFQRR